MPVRAARVRDASPDPWRAGVRVDRYELLQQIGAGGMGVVWSARDVALGRHVAVKLIRSPEYGPGVRLLLDERALSEARAMARLSHPNVVTIHDVGSTDEGMFIAMERLEGGTLADWLRAETRSWPDVIAKFIAAGRGLAEAHRAGLVHRDFKPDNVLLGRDDVVRVSDFGLALPLGEPQDGPRRQDDPRGLSVTQEGEVAGTLPYMAPEQLMGQRVDARSDQFSFCAALFEALHGSKPFGQPTGDAPAAALLAAILERRFATPRRRCRVPRRIQALMFRGLASDPIDRWPSMESLVSELAGRSPSERPWLVHAGLAVVTSFAVAWSVLWRPPVTATSPGPGRYAGTAILDRVLSRFRDSGAVARCEYSYPAEGEWAVELELDPAARRIVPHASGTLAVDGVGSCLMAELEYVIDSTPIPQGLERTFVSREVTLPLPR